MNNFKKQSKIINILMLFVLSFTLIFTAFFVNSNAYGEETSNFKSKSLIAIDPVSKLVVYEKNAHEKLPVASVVKVMTMLLSMEYIEANNIPLETEITVSENASSMGGSQVFLETGGTYKLGELLKSVMVASANDSAVALAEFVSGTHENFVAKMNERASELGMNNTVYVNATGLPQAGQFSTAYDIALVFSELVKHEKLFDYSKIWMEDFIHPEGRTTMMSNTNKLLKSYSSCDIGKTGFTNEAMFCFAASAFKNNTRVVAVVLGAPTSKDRFSETVNLFNTAFATYDNKIILNKDEPMTIEIKNGKKDSIMVIPQESYSRFVKKGEDNVSVEITFDENLKAPVKKGDIVGKAMIIADNTVVKEINILAAEDIDSMTLWDIIKEIGRNFKIKK